MKKIYVLIVLGLLGVSSMDLFAAFSIDPAKTYILIQTLATSSKVIGANGTTPSVMSADISAQSQRLTFEMQSAGVYKIKNGDGNYLACNSSGVVGFTTTNSSQDTNWNITEIGTAKYISINSVSSPTSYLTSAAVITGPAAFTGTPLTLTTTVPTGTEASAAFRYVEYSTTFANGDADGGFENVTANTLNLTAPMGEWINDKSKNIGGGATSRVVSTYTITGIKNFPLRYTAATSTNGYYNISHKLNGLIAGNTYTFSFKYRTDDGANTNTFGTNSQANVYATTTANATVANAIGGPSNYFTTIQPATNILSQTPTTGSVTFITPASSCYIVFSKVVQADAPSFYVYMDDMTLTLPISAFVNNSVMGSVSGAGMIALNSTDTLIATPSEGYRFVNWTEGGVEVSKSASYSFKVTTNRTLVANFALSISAIESNRESNFNITTFRNADGQITVNCPIEMVGKATISVYNVVGQKLEDKLLTNSKMTLNNSYKAAVYIVDVVANDQVITRKTIFN